MRKPYWSNRERCWFVKNTEGRNIRLDPDETKAFDIWRDMLATTQYCGPQATVIGLLVHFLDELQPNLSQVRDDCLVRYASLFADDHGRELASSITPATVLRWLEKEKLIGEDRSIKWSSSSKHQAAALLKRSWKWAHNEGHVRTNTLHSLKLPAIEYRNKGIDYETHKRLLEHCRGNYQARPFALYLIASRCGARPQQIRDVSSAHVVEIGGQIKWVFKKHKTVAKTNKPLIVYLSPCLQTLTRILIAKRPTGALFRNWNGDPWKKGTVTQRMDRLRTRQKLPKGTVVYLYRHAMATDALLAGLPTAVVAQLLWHTDTRMVSKVYSHLDQHKSEMISSAAKVAARRLSTQS